ncbi:hypothetical protein HRbin36_02529 [bacterium HR36]|nr:hypothetical protein HRbin36_02529 [bacterium HR36]
MQHGIRQLRIVLTVLVLKSPHVVRYDDTQTLSARQLVGKAHPQIVAMSLHRSRHRPWIHAVWADTDWPTASSRTKRQYPIETV